LANTIKVRKFLVQLTHQLIIHFGAWCNRLTRHLPGPGGIAESATAMYRLLVNFARGQPLGQIR